LDSKEVFVFNSFIVNVVIGSRFAKNQLMMDNPPLPQLFLGYLCPIYPAATATSGEYDDFMAIGGELINFGNTFQLGGGIRVVTSQSGA